MLTTRDFIVLLILAVLAVAFWVLPSTRPYRGTAVGVVLGAIVGFLLAHVI
jgi:hypothetical protein